MAGIPIEQQGCGYHEWGDTTIVTANWVIPPTAEADTQPAVFKEGSLVMEHTCTKCGVVSRWTV